MVQPGWETRRGQSSLRTGWVDINGGKTNSISPFEGYEQPGFGRALGIYGMEPYSGMKSIQLSGKKNGGPTKDIRINL